MLYERGPLALLTESEIPRAAPATSIVGAIAAHVAAFHAEESALGGRAAHVAAGLDPTLDAAGAAELAAATSATNTTAAETDARISNALGASNAIEGDLSGIVLGIDPGMFGLAPQFVPPPSEGGGGDVSPNPPEL